MACSRQYIVKILGQGFGGYDLKSVADNAFAFDYNHSGKQDHLALSNRRGHYLDS